MCVKWRFSRKGRILSQKTPNKGIWPYDRKPQPWKGHSFRHNLVCSERLHSTAACYQETTQARKEESFYPQRQKSTKQPKIKTKTNQTSKTKTNPRVISETLMKSRIWGLPHHCGLHSPASTSARVTLSTFKSDLDITSSEALQRRRIALRVVVKTLSVISLCVKQILPLSLWAWSPALSIMASILTPDSVSPPATGHLEKSFCPDTFSQKLFLSSFSLRLYLSSIISSCQPPQQGCGLLNFRSTVDSVFPRELR